MAPAVNASVALELLAGVDACFPRLRETLQKKGEKRRGKAAGSHRSIVNMGKGAWENG